VYRKTVRIEKIVGTTYTDTTVYNGTLYTYVVRATRDGYESGPSTEVTLLFYQTPLIRNYGLRVRLEWEPIVGASEYQISTSQWSTVIPNGLSTVAYKDSLVSSGSVYAYWVNVRMPAAIDFTPMGSNQIEFIAYPQVFQYNRWGTNNVSLSWAGIPGAQSYLLAVSTPVGQSYSYAVSSTTYSMTAPNTVYSFQLEAIGQSNVSSKSDIHWIFHSPPARQFYPEPLWKTEQIASLDVSGAPIHTVGPDGNLYFAISTRGTFGTLTDSYPKTGITLGAMSPTGTLLWSFRHPSLYTGVGDGNPALVFGEAGELYVAFLTTGAVPGRWNMADVVNLCGPCGTFAGRKDIVVSRIDGALQGTPRVTWRIQDANINSCSDETLPFLMYDSYGKRLLVAYQCVGSVLCGNNIVTDPEGPAIFQIDRDTRVGSPTIVVSGFDVSGRRLWTYQDPTLNGPGQNTSPQVAVDRDGHVYVAYCVTQRPGSSQPLPTRSIELVRFRAVQPYPNVGVVGIRDWIQSSIQPLSIPGYIHSDPTLLSDPVRNQLYVAFCISQTEGGPGRIVFACLSFTGTILWIKNDDRYNDQIAGRSIQRPVLRLDAAGTLYAGVQVLGETTETILFRIRPDTGESLWQSLNTLTSGQVPTFLATYTPMSSLTTRYPNGVYPSGASFSDPSLSSASLSNLTLCVYRYPNEFHTLSFNPIQQYSYPVQGTVVVSYP
jgi:hypothetical protein